jgi:hypothetical protein
VGGESNADNIGQQLSNPVDWAFSPQVLSFRNAGYTSVISHADSGLPLYLQMDGADGDTALNSTLAHLKSSVTDTAGIYVHLNETVADSGVYRVASSPESQASTGTTSDQAAYRLGAGEGEAITAAFAPDTSKTAALSLSACPRGDSDQSGQVNISDMIALLRIVLALDQQPQNEDQSCLQDLDVNGVVNILDVIGALRIVLEL